MAESQKYHGVQVQGVVVALYWQATGGESHSIGAPAGTGACFYLEPVESGQRMAEISLRTLLLQLRGQESGLFHDLFKQHLAEGRGAE